MKLKLSLILIVLCSLTNAAQKIDEKAQIAARQIILKKQIVADEIDRQARDIPFADVRVFVRTRLAEWLWKGGKDETGRAEPLAVKAFEELYEKKDEIVAPHSLKANLFILFDIHATETGQRLRAKYNVGAGEDLMSAFSLLNRKGSDKIVAEKIKKALVSEKDLGRIQLYLPWFQRQKSPEFLSILSEILRLHESSVNNYSAASLYWIAGNFTDSETPHDLKIRFYRIALNKGANALESADGGEINFTDQLLFRILPDMIKVAPALATEAAGIKSVLSAKVPQRIKDLQELEQRISESSNQLEAIIAEAEKTNDKNLRYSLLNRASRLAVTEKKFQLAIDLNEKSIQEEIDAKLLDREFRISVHDQQAAHIINDALLIDDVQSADFAVKKITDNLIKADALRSLASYYLRKKNSAGVTFAYEESLNLTLKAKDDKSKISSLLSLISLTNSIDRSRVSEITSITARTINKIPTLNVEDKPGTERFKEYVSTIASVNMHLQIVVSNLSRMNRNEAVIFTKQINNKELRLVADLALATSMFEPEQK